MDPILARDGRTRSIASDVFVGCVIVGGLYLGRQFLLPIVLAILLSFILSPLVVRLHRWGLGQAPSVCAVVLLAFVVVAGVATLIGMQMTQLAAELPRYQTTLEEKVRSVRDAASGGSILKGLSDMMSNINKEISRPSPVAPPPTAMAVPTAQPAAPEQPPTPVIVRQPEARPLQAMKDIAEPILEPLATVGLIVIFVVFILFQREELRDRLIWLAGSRDLRRATVAVDDAAERLSRYFLAQTIINAGFGATVGFGLWLIGLPNPLLWGVLAMLLRFVPYIGPIAAAALPLLIAAAVDPGWSKVGLTLLVFAVLEPLVGQVIEPLVYGRSTGLSPFAVIIAATFWTWLWGPVGLVLSTPLTLLLVVVGQHVEKLSFLAVLLGDAPALTPVQSFFHRIMSGDADEAAEQGERFLKDKTLVEYYDEVALPGLRMAQVEANRDMIDAGRIREMAATVMEVVDNFAENDVATADPKKPDGDAKAKEAAEPALPAPTLLPEWRTEAPVLCIAGRSALDEAAACMFRQLLAQHGIGVRIASSGTASPAQIAKLDTTGVALVCLSYLAVEGSPTHTRFLIRRLRRKAPGTRILAGFWTFQGEPAMVEELRSEAGADFVATTMKAAVELCVKQATVGQEETVGERTTIQAVA